MTSTTEHQTGPAWKEQGFASAANWRDELPSGSRKHQEQPGDNLIIGRGQTLADGANPGPSFQL